jgi:hypothetical protein
MEATMNEAQVKVTVAGQSRTVAKALALDTAAEMGASATNLPTFEDLAPKAVRGVTVDGDGKARSETDRAAAEAAGYKTAETVYARGTMVNATGVANARASYAEWKAMPQTTKACEALEAQVQAEDRRDVEARSGDVKLDDLGRVIGLPCPSPAEDYSHRLSTRAIKSLCSRLGSGGGQYLANEVSGPLLAANLREQLAKTPAVDLTLRTRVRGGGREVFGVVSQKYHAFDADQIARSVGRAMPSDVRGHVSYDGYRTRIEGLLQSTVQPENFVAGEFFRAGVVVTSDDAGGGGITVMGMVLQNLCLNLIILDESWQNFGRFIHIGRKTITLEERIEASVKAAAASLDHFRQVWGYAARENAIDDGGQQLMRDVAMAGLFRGILNKELVALPGKVEDRVPQLVQAWKLDESSATSTVPTSRAAVVNAFTRLAHTDGGLDAWTQDEISRDAANLLHLKSFPFDAGKAAKAA